MTLYTFTIVDGLWTLQSAQPVQHCIAAALRAMAVGDGFVSAFCAGGL